MKLKLSSTEAEELVRLIDEEAQINEAMMQEIKRRILSEEDPVHVRCDDLEDLLNMLPVSWVDIHELTNPHCAERTSRKGKVKPCLTCKLSQKRELAIKRLREALGMPVGATR